MKSRQSTVESQEDRCLEKPVGKGVRSGLWMLLGAVALLVTFVSGTAISTEPSGSASSAAGPAPSTSTSMSASASAKVVRDPPPEPLEAQSIPTSPSERPTPEEWKTAKQVEISRRSPDGKQCRAYLVREWLKVHCPILLTGIRQFGGSSEGVLLWVGEVSEQSMWQFRNGGQVIVPMRPGDRRVFQFFELVGGEYQGIWSSPSVILDETWIEGDKAPTLVLR